MALHPALLVLLLLFVPARAALTSSNVSSCASNVTSLTASVVVLQQTVTALITSAVAVGACVIPHTSTSLQTLISSRPAAIVLCPSTLLVSQTLAISTSISISCFAVTNPPSCILNGQNAVEVMSVSGGGVVLTLIGLELTARRVSAVPGRLSRSLLARSLVFLPQNGSSYNGGGLAITPGASVVVQHSTFDHNKAAHVRQEATPPPLGSHARSVVAACTSKPIMISPTSSPSLRRTALRRIPQCVPLPETAEHLTHNFTVCWWRRL